MTAQLLDGKATAAAIRRELAERVAELTATRQSPPGLGTVLVGDDPGSHAYVGGKHRDCAQVGIASIRRELPADATQEQVEARRSTSSTPTRPAPATSSSSRCPRHLDANAVLERMDPAKDADGLHPVNLGRLVLGVDGPLPCTPRGIVELLRRTRCRSPAPRSCVIGRGITVGRPLGLLLTRRSENATVTLCHTGTKDLAWHIREADIVVAAAGSPGLDHHGHDRPGAVPSSTSASPAPTGRARRRRHPDAAEVAGWLAPMPGGVGPMTRAMLLANVVEAAERNATAV